MLLFSHGLAIPRSVYPRFFDFSRHGRTAVRRSANVFTRRARSKKFQHFQPQKDLRGRNRRSL